jgi:dUTP pyrophosphatase
LIDVKLLHPDAKAPTVAHKGEDIGYDVYALEHVVLRPGVPTKVRTGIAVEAYGHRAVPSALMPGKVSAVKTPLGLLIRDRSSIAARGIITSGGVIDAGYRGEIIVLMTLNLNCFQSTYRGSDGGYGFDISAGDKIAQMVPIQALTGDVNVVETLTEMKRGDAGFGSSGT